jgi:hypothetical protein
MTPLLLALSLSCAADPHEAINPLYRELRTEGVAVSAKERVPLPAPVMPDGLDAKAQRKVIEQVAAGDYDPDELARRSVVTPFVLRIRDVKSSDPKNPVRGVDLYYVAYGSLDVSLDEAFAEKLMSDSKQEGKAKSLTPEDLAKRKIDFKPDEKKRESYGHVEFEFLERVEIRATGRSFWTRTDESFLSAMRLDPRFVGDPEFPNQWRSIDRVDPKKRGPAQPYAGSGHYLKVTRLHEPKGALFVEFHVVFVEPYGWFDGANLLRSKLPPVAQSVVRSMRRELLKMSK